VWHVPPRTLQVKVLQRVFARLSKQRSRFGSHRAPLPPPRPTQIAGPGLPFSLEGGFGPVPAQIGGGNLFVFVILFLAPLTPGGPGEGPACHFPLSGFGQAPARIGGVISVHGTARHVHPHFSPSFPPPSEIWTYPKPIAGPAPPYSDAVAELSFSFLNSFC
jgi:hypothetical protein